MNLFVLDTNTTQAARYHCDQHVFKMAVEAAQILSSAVAYLANNYVEVPNKDGSRKLRTFRAMEGLYKPTHYNHPCTKWVRGSEQNARWAYYLGLDLLHECEYRGLKRSDRVREVLRNVNLYWRFFPSMPQTPFVCAINAKLYPTVVINPADPVATYRDYYRKGKAVFPTKGPATWRARGKPEWWQ